MACEHKNMYTIIGASIHISLIYTNGVGRCQKGGGGGEAHRHVIYVPSVKNQYKQGVFGYMVMH